MNSLLATIGEYAVLSVLAVAALIFLGAGLLAVWSATTSLYHYPHGFLNYTKAVTPRFSVAIAAQIAVSLLVTDAPLELVVGGSFVLYVWIFLLFSNIEAPTYTSKSPSSSLQS